MKIRLRAALFAAAVALTGTASADTIQASSTTMLVGRQDYRNGAVQTAVPVFEIIDLSATDVATSFADNVEVSLSMWGALDVGNHVRFWQNGALSTDKRLSGDINIAFVRGEWLGRRLSLRLGRQLVAEGAARMLHLDGGELRLALPAGFGISGYAGLPVSPRFQAYGGPFSTGNTRGNFATGGRVFWRSPGLLDVGASVALARDRGDLSRSELGADFKLTPHRMLALLGSGWWSLYESRVGEASLAAMVTPVRQLDFTVDYRHVEPDLFLPRNSILAVFAADKRNDLGGNVHWRVVPNLALDADYHVLLEDAGTGHWLRAKVTYHPEGPSSTLGAETSYVYHPFNAYALARLFGAKTISALTGTLDLYGYFFERRVNGQAQALTATGTLGYGFARGWRAVVAGTAGTTAYLSNQFEVMAKLVYDQTYVTREVR